MDPAPKQQDETQVTQFAVTNLAELLERTGYYGFTSVLGLYLADLGHSAAVVGAIATILLAVPYVLPLLTGPLAEKVGYKPVMLVSLALYAGGFTVLWSFSTLGLILAGTILVAVGAGGFKPVATATIAHVTALRHRSLGYTIYYTGINVGGFLGPLAVALLTDDYAAGFLVAAIIMATALVLTLTAFRNPQPPQRELSMAGALAKHRSLLEDPRLIVLIVVFAGFWFLYSMNFSLLALYLDSFVALPDWFEPSLQQSFNPFIIIFLGIPIGALATRKDPRAMMTIGVLLYVVGFTLLAFVQRVEAFFAGLFIATVGEILAYPAFLNYIASIAPKDRIAVYQSYGFLPLFIGFLLGPLASGPIYESVAEGMGRPELFWAFPISLGILSLVGFLAVAARDLPERRQQRGGYTRAALVLLLVPLLFGAAVLAGTQAEGEPGATRGLVSVDLAATDGSTQEGQTTDVLVDVPLDARGNLTFRLVWQDEAAGGGATNRPDTFRLSALASGGRDLGSVEGDGGDLVLVVPASGLQLDRVTVKVTLVSAGDQVVPVPIAGDQVVAADGGNDWTLQPAKQVEDPAEPTDS